MNARSFPQIPDTAPFSAAQRLWLHGYIAALLSSGESRSDPAPLSSPKERVLVLYASQSGNSEELAEAFGEQLVAAGFEARFLGMENHDEVDLMRESTLLVVSSTWGEGDPPDNAVEFWEKLSADEHPRLENLRFVVLGLGDSNYLDFCGMGKKFDARFESLGATRLAARGDCDTDFEDAAKAWFDTVLTKLKSVTGPAEPLAAAGSIDLPETGTESADYSKKNPFPAKLLTNRLLNAQESSRDTRHFEISLEGSGLQYEVGDVLGVFPKNDPELVDELILTLSLNPEELVPLPNGGKAPLRAALLEDYDIRTVNRALLENWHGFGASDSITTLPQSGAKDSDVDEYLSGCEIIDLALRHPATFSSAAEFTGLLRKLGPRLYSISSSPKAHPGQVHLTVAKVTYESHGRPRKGVCSTYLADRVNGDGAVRVFLQTAKHFKLPADLSKPVIMVGPGTGIAPFRAFLEEREATNASGKNWLFFGNPHETTDWFYREEFEAMRERGVLTRLSTAWSRDQDRKIYVQDRMREAGAELWDWLDGGTHFYVCGDAKRMAKDVDAALHDVIAEHGGRSGDAAAGYVATMKKSKRYQRDVY